LYFTTSVPSAIYLFYDFHYWHGIVHVIMQVWYSGAFTLMMHNVKLPTCFESNSSQGIL